MGADSIVEQSPLFVDPQQVAWDDHADLAVVGFGGAGAAAALQAREHGVDVLAVDRFLGGGASARSGGVIYTGNTKYQREAGFDDPPEQMFRYLRAEGTPLQDETLLRFCRESSENLEWLEGFGVPYGGNAYLEKTSFPPDGHWLYYSGNEKIPRFAEQARPAPRGHRPAIPGFGGQLQFSRMREAAVERGVRFLNHARVTRLVVDRDGRVLGVQASVLEEKAHAEQMRLYDLIDPWNPLTNKRSERAIKQCRELEAQSETKLIRADIGVLLSTGGFIFNLEMLAQHAPNVARNFESLARNGALGCDGSGIILGKSVGGDTALMDRIFLGKSIAPPNELLSGVVVNVSGKRFVNEDAYVAVLGGAIAKQPVDGCAWLVIDAAGFRKAVKQALFPGKGRFLMWGAPTLVNILLGGTKRAGTLAGLARKCGVSEEGLMRTIADYNSVAAGQGEDEFGKRLDNIRELKGKAFYAINMSLSNKFSPTLAFTLGGLVIDEGTGHVLDRNGQRIDGLFAAGRAAVGVCSLGYVSGMSVADTIFSGRRAGRTAGMLKVHARNLDDPHVSGQTGHTNVGKVCDEAD